MGSETNARESILNWASQDRKTMLTKGLQCDMNISKLLADKCNNGDRHIGILKKDWLVGNWIYRMFKKKMIWLWKARGSSHKIVSKNESINYIHSMCGDSML